MKLIHLSDLHIGKRVNEFPMLEDQKYILNEILSIIGQEKPEAVLIAGRCRLPRRSRYLIHSSPAWLIAACLCL